MHYENLSDDGTRVAAHVNKPPEWLIRKVRRLNADHTVGRGMMAEYIAQAQQQMRQLGTRENCQFPGREYGKLFRSDYLHVGGEDCTDCDESAVERSRLDRDEPCVHLGLIASGSSAMRSAQTRDNLRKERNILCFETEAAGLDNFPCLVIRGISDYADDHKNDGWQGYAAITSAAYAKDPLRIMH